MKGRKNITLVIWAWGRGHGAWGIRQAYWIMEVNWGNG